MRAVVQRVSSASVTVHGEVVGEVGRGLCVFVGVTQQDTPDDATWIAEKLAHLRLFSAPEDRAALSVLGLGGGVLVVSQFTLYGDVSKGRRPSWTRAAPSAHAEPLVEAVVARLRALGVSTATGVFGADMQVAMVNDGPVTLILER
ncbi:MAG: D-tyrosyl-tRNA(Tyr) deacylase [Nitriliruptoraceae bacterium]|jgi:D-tyrosyl-tRNA(Tyr) deacylase